MADFCLVTRRTLTESEHQLFRYHFLLGADWKLCTLRMKMDRGSFFHAVYRIEEKLGRSFREVQPYALFPLSDYFHGPSRIGPPLPRPEDRKHIPEHLRFPPIGRAA